MFRESFSRRTCSRFFSLMICCFSQTLTVNKRRDTHIYISKIQHKIGVYKRDKAIHDRGRKFSTRSRLNFSPVAEARVVEHIIY